MWSSWFGKKGEEGERERKRLGGEKEKEEAGVLKGKGVERASAVDRRKDIGKRNRPTQSERAASDGEGEERVRGGEGGKKRGGVKKEEVGGHLAMIMTEEGEEAEKSGGEEDGGRDGGGGDEKNSPIPAEEGSEDVDDVSTSSNASSRTPSHNPSLTPSRVPSSVILQSSSASAAIDASHLRAESDFLAQVRGKGWLSPADVAVASVRKMRNTESSLLYLTCTFSLHSMHRNAFSLL